MSGGNITNDGGSPVEQRGVCLSVHVSPTIADTLVASGNGMGAFSAKLQGLKALTTYFLRAYATTKAGTAYGNETTFTTLGFASLTTSPVGLVTMTTAVLGGSILNGGGTEIAERGICYSTSKAPTISATTIASGSGLGDFSIVVSELTTNTTYYVRTYAINIVGTIYGNEISFTTASLPSLTTVSVSQITQTGARSGGMITQAGNTVVSQRGICFDTSNNPTLLSHVVLSGTGTGNFASVLSGLMPGTTYFVRAFATNSSGTAYGNEVSFFTNPVLIPTVSTSSASSVTKISAVSGGNVTNDGGGAVLLKGLCYDTSPNPEMGQNTIEKGSGTGNFTANLVNLIPGTTYYVRAFASNSAGTAYGKEVSFTTSPVVLPTVSSSSATSVTKISAVSGGNVTNDGGGIILGRGICYGTSHTPTIAQNVIENGGGSGIFTSSMIGLTPGTLYYVRAFATNSAGTAYGNEVNFTTSPELKLGQSYQGGLIFYLDGTTLHGLVSTTFDLSAGAPWGCSGTLIAGSLGLVFGTGLSNTNAIVSVCASIGTAAKVCSDLVTGGYSDWYLPSRDELSLMHEQLKIKGLGGFANSNYWSSSEFSATSSYIQSFSNGSIGQLAKTSMARVRAIRSF
jgi:hypothetical protein